MIEVQDLRFHVDGKTILHQVDFVALPGEITLIVGPNGSGKSTIVKCLAGELKASNGCITLNDKEIHRIAVRDQAKFRAVLSQHNDIEFPIKVSEVIMMGRYPHFDIRPSERDTHIVDELTKLFELTSFSDRDYRTLSGGEKQRVQFARVFAQIFDVEENGLLFLDEPLTYLDLQHQIAFMETLKSFIQYRKITVIGVIHDLNLALRYSDQLLLLHQGNLIEKGRAEQVLTRENVKIVFGLDVEFTSIKGNLHLIY